MNPHLIFHLVTGIASIAALLVAAVLVIRKTTDATVAWTVGATMIGAAIAQAAYVVGVAVPDPSLSWQLQLVDAGIALLAATTLHCSLAVVRRADTERGTIAVAYGLAIAFVAVVAYAPALFIAGTGPVLYFPNYFVPGALFGFFTIVFKAIIPAYAIYRIFAAARASDDPIEQKRYAYFGCAFLFGWASANASTMLVFGVPIDPAWGNLIGVLFVAPLAYAIVRYELFDIRVLAKRAFAYSMAVIVTGFAIESFNYASGWLAAAYPDFPVWVMPFILAIAIATVGALIWNALKEEEVLKSEFITTVTHKFRTPLTHIKWAAENLKSAAVRPEFADQLSYIEDANSKLVELTDLLVNSSEDSSALYRYHLAPDDLSKLVADTARGSMSHAAAKRIILTEEIEPGVRAVLDAGRLRFVLQTLIENAINYTPEGGSVKVRVGRTSQGEAFCSVADSGIGISKQELPRIASRLYRGQRARVTDTEGMGIGLYVSKGIVERHRGRLLVESDGEGRGSTFSVFLPAATA